VLPGDLQDVFIEPQVRELGDEVCQATIGHIAQPVLCASENCR
jgi:hypothetical protein